MQQLSVMPEGILVYRWFFLLSVLIMIILIISVIWLVIEVNSLSAVHQKTSKTEVSSCETSTPKAWTWDVKWKDKKGNKLVEEWAKKDKAWALFMEIQLSPYRLDIGQVPLPKGLPPKIFKVNLFFSLNENWDYLSSYRFFDSPSDYWGPDSELKSLFDPLLFDEESNDEFERLDDEFSDLDDGFSDSDGGFSDSDGGSSDSDDGSSDSDDKF